MTGLVKLSRQSWRKWQNYCLLSLLLGALSACASWYDVNVSQPVKYQAPTRIDESYNISGRFFIKTETKDYYGNFNWQHESKSDEVELLTPLRTTVAEISLKDNLATLIVSKQKYSGDNLKQMMIERLGFSLPLTYLHYWLQGVPLPQYPVQQRLPTGFSQLGWQIDYLSWQDAEHPHILQVSNGQLHIKLLLNWPESQ